MIVMLATRVFMIDVEHAAESKADEGDGDDDGDDNELRMRI